MAMFRRDDPDAERKMRAMFGPGQVDQHVRQAIQMCWMALPENAKTVDELEKQFRRIVDRALQDLKDDAKAFGLHDRRNQMAAFQIVTTIAAPIELCFDLARDIDFHTQSLADTGERAVAGRTTGLIELGESVTWEARHFDVRQRFTAKVTAFDRPTFFRDVMTAGAFKSFEHDHRFEERDGGTLMIDEVALQSPFGPLGWLVDRLFMTNYMRRLLRVRCQALKQKAESVASSSS